MDARLFVDRFQAVSHVEFSLNWEENWRSQTQCKMIVCIKKITEVFEHSFLLFGFCKEQLIALCRNVSFIHAAITNLKHSEFIDSKYSD